ncbi:hypothetical protein IEQ34_026923 [Dendrobium chrysotoxum]|uniref:Uncharacterized protein n=1 Tax=Dendrobium chrysotoxum TaxID=161865 RepID=A0AAV7FIB2_DENCH|nr:hypothetical protein IEQ34_026923 [Dendrobium chrysotoxum]
MAIRDQENIKGPSPLKKGAPNPKEKRERSEIALASLFLLDHRRSSTGPPPDTLSSARPPHDVLNFAGPPLDALSSAEPPPDFLNSARPPPDLLNSVGPLLDALSSIRPPPDVLNSAGPPLDALSFARPPPDILNSAIPPPDILNSGRPPPDTLSFTVPPPQVLSSARPPPKARPFVGPPPEAWTFARPPLDILSSTGQPPKIQGSTRPPRRSQNSARSSGDPEVSFCLVQLSYCFLARAELCSVGGAKGANESSQARVRRREANALRYSKEKDWLTCGIGNGGFDVGVGDASEPSGIANELTGGARGEGAFIELVATASREYDRVGGGERELVPMEEQEELSKMKAEEANRKLANNIFLLARRGERSECPTIFKREDWLTCRVGGGGFDVGAGDASELSRIANKLARGARGEGAFIEIVAAASREHDGVGGGELELVLAEEQEDVSKMKAEEANRKLANNIFLLVRSPNETRLSFSLRLRLPICIVSICLPLLCELLNEPA